ncbi:hypothetical protein [Mesorhizobium sophorae]|uniref:hypothetical protein n=1 Tax=Mesorhizobium sophorae TaxID=1300294 RepID=UPI001180922A|nr:hypothetical protein [Mesorhizobium sophorae]
MPLSKVALIGSFRRHNYGRVQSALRIFEAAGLEVTSPSGADIASGDQFVRFTTDLAHRTDAEIQTATLERIYSADAVYVVTGENGYVGRTTCYEIGRVIQRRQPLYFSEYPDDIPVHIESGHVVMPEEFVLRFVTNREPLAWLFETGTGELFDGERRLAGWEQLARNKEELRP